MIEGHMFLYQLTAYGLGNEADGGAASRTLHTQDGAASRRSSDETYRRRLSERSTI